MGLNRRQELFVDGILAGLPATEAYRKAGYKCKKDADRTAAASRLAASANVANELARRRELARQAADVRAADVIAGLLEQAKRSDKKSTHAATVAAWAMLARCLGMVSATHKHTGHKGGPIEYEHVDPRTLTDEQLDERLAELEARERAAGEGAGEGGTAGD